MSLVLFLARPYIRLTIILHTFWPPKGSSYNPDIINFIVITIFTKKIIFNILPSLSACHCANKKDHHLLNYLLFYILYLCWCCPTNIPEKIPELLSIMPTAGFARIIEYIHKMWFLKYPF